MRSIQRKIMHKEEKWKVYKVYFAKCILCTMLDSADNGFLAYSRTCRCSPAPSQSIDSVYQTHLQGEHQNFLLLGKLFRMMCDHTCPHLLRCDQICEHIIMWIIDIFVICEHISSMEYVSIHINISCFVFVWLCNIVRCAWLHARWSVSI